MTRAPIALPISTAVTRPRRQRRAQGASRPLAGAPDGSARNAGCRTQPETRRRSRNPSPPRSHHRGSVEHDLLGVTTAGAQYREDALTGPQVADGSPGLDHLAGGFKPGRKWKRRLDLVAPANHHRVGKINARRTHPNAHLMRLLASGSPPLRLNVSGRPILGSGSPSSPAPSPAPDGPVDDDCKSPAMGVSLRQSACEGCTIRRFSRGSQIREIRLAHIAIVSIDDAPRLNAMTRQMTPIQSRSSPRSTATA
jgi:hypothetical protein